jgi:signal transduction histidine kinase
MAAAINKEEGHVYSFAINHNGIGVAYYNMGKLDSSRGNYQIALKGFQSVNDREKEAIALNNIANVLVDQGDSLEKALEYYQQALAVFEKLDDIHNTTFAMESLGAAYLAMGDEKKALETLRSGLALVEKNRGGYYIHQSYYKDITKTYEKMGRVNEAYAAYKLYRTYLDSLHQKERIRQVAELEKKFEMEKKEAEILRLNAEKKVGLLQIQKEKTIRISVTVLLLLTIVIMIYISYGYYEKKRTNLVLNQKNEQIEHQRSELEKANATKNRFFSILAHDLKNPFHTILGYSSLLDRDYDRFTASECRKYAGDIYKSANHIFRLLQNLLDWSRSQTGNLKYNPVCFDLKQLSDIVYSLLRPVADQKNITLNSHILSGTYVYADPMMIETILRNLISNAIKFSFAGGRVLTEIKQDEPGQVTICVHDQGQGLSQDDLQQLFLIDSKVRRKGTQGEDGTGLGLTLCKEFVQINKGTIRVESEPGKGSSFCITIPAVSPDA